MWKNGCLQRGEWLEYFQVYKTIEAQISSLIFLIGNFIAYRCLTEAPGVHQH